MDLALNISTSSSKCALKLKPSSAANKRKSNTAGFDFNFVKNDKVKAIVVAKKRPAKVIPDANKSNVQNEPKTKSPQKPFGEMNEKQQPSQKIVKNDKNIDSLLDIARVKKPEDNASISLNIDTHIDFSKIPVNKLPFADKKKKLSRNERKERVMQRRIDASQVKHDKRTPNVSRTVPTVTDNKTERTDASPQTNPFQSKVQQTNRPRKTESLFKNNPAIPNIGQRFVKPINEIVFTGLPMDSIGLHPHLVKTMADLLEVTELTTVQQRAVPIALEGRDILVRSQTGSGKTLAYALPIVQQLQEMQPTLSRTDGIYALVIVPTRELAIQTLEVFTKLLKPFRWLVPTYITGGEKRKSEKARLRKGVNILIGTPGRICDHLLHTESFKLDKVKYLVLDEADRLYECGYEKDVKIIIDSLNKAAEGLNPFMKSKVDDESEPMKLVKDSKLQTSLLSATLSPAVHQLAGLALKNPLYIDTSDVKDVQLPKKTNPIKDVKEQTTEMEAAEGESGTTDTIVIPEKVTQTYVLVPPKLRLVTLAGLIAKETYAPKKSLKILVFMATENLVDFHYDLMTEALTKKVIDSDDEGDESDDDDGMALPSDDDDDDDLEDVDGLLDKVKSNRKKQNSSRPLLADVKFFKLHGSLTQQERSAIFKAFKEAKSGVLLTTDVTARGIDVPMVDLVIQFSSPHKIVDYVHRVGRTARGGLSGSAVLFLAPNEVEFIRTLESKRIRIAQYDYKAYLKGIQENSDLVTGTIEEMASELQRKFEALVNDDKDIYEKACKAFVSWLRYISSFPKDLRTIFNVKNAHMGHYAKSLALREPPKSFTKQYSQPKAPLPQNRLTYTDRNKNRSAKPDRSAAQQSVNKNGMKRPAHSLTKFISKSISLSTSEFDSGLPAMKKRKK